jgi:mannose/cellobiose epimerase-like protein (N-acyl-D-glucosamine 2-epimerase family)
MKLAEHFLEDYDVTPPENYKVVADRLAERIQRGIEDDLDDLMAEGKIEIRKWSKP